MNYHHHPQPWEWYVVGACILLLLLCTYRLWSDHPKRRRYPR